MQKFCSLLIEIGEFEAAIEEVRQLICSFEDFGLYKSFQRIDRLNQGFITTKDIRDFLKDSSLFVTLDEASLYINHYDSSKLNRMVYTDFVRSVLPLCDKERRIEVVQRKVKGNQSKEYLNSGVEYAISKLIKKNIEFYQVLEGKKVEMKRVNLREVFLKVDCFRNGTIDVHNL